MYIRTCKRGHEITTENSKFYYKDGIIRYECKECREFIRPKVNRRLPTEERFWFNINKDGPLHPTLNTNCWLWLGSMCGEYGLICINQVYIYVHRYSLSLIEKVKDENIVHHKCEIKRCVRQDHLQQLTDFQHKSLHMMEFYHGPN